jgi:hypothetical protein
MRKLSLHWLTSSRCHLERSQQVSRDIKRHVISEPRAVLSVTYACDSCGKPLTREWPEMEENGNCAHELVITLDQEECVNFFRQRDYCPDCLNPIWDAINKLIGADPDVERDKEYELLAFKCPGGR